jgi:hypothetical protein
MVDGLHITMWNRTKKHFAIALGSLERGLRGKDNGRNVNNVQYKSDWNMHFEYPLYNEYILIKIYFKIFLALSSNINPHTIGSLLSILY